MRHTITESRQFRCIVGRLAAGEELLRGLLTVCREKNVRCGSVQLTGVVQEISLAHHEPAAGGPGMARHFRGHLQLVSAYGIAAERDGKLDLPLSVVVSRVTDNGVELLGGVCAGAKVLACEFSIQAWDDLLLRRLADKAAGITAIAEAFSAAQPVASAAADQAPEPTPATPRNPAEPDFGPGDRTPVAARKAGSAATPPVVSTKPTPTLAVEDPPPMVEPVKPKRQPRPEPARIPSAPQVSSLPEPEPVLHEPEGDLWGEERPVQIGDVLEHPRFGPCVVQKTSEDDDYVTVRMRNNRSIRLSLEVLELEFDRDDEAGHQVFKVIPVGR